MFEAVGSEASLVGSSRHTEAHGEFGVTCKADDTFNKRRNRTTDPREVPAMLRPSRMKEILS